MKNFGISKTASTTIMFFLIVCLTYVFYSCNQDIIDERYIYKYTVCIFTILVLFFLWQIPPGVVAKLYFLGMDTGIRWGEGFCLLPAIPALRKILVSFPFALVMDGDKYLTPPPQAPQVMNQNNSAWPMHHITHDRLSTKWVIASKLSARVLSIFFPAINPYDRNMLFHNLGMWMLSFSLIAYFPLVWSSPKPQILEYMAQQGQCLNVPTRVKVMATTSSNPVKIYDLDEKVELVLKDKDKTITSWSIFAKAIKQKPDTYYNPPIVIAVTSSSGGKICF